MASPGIPLARDGYPLIGGCLAAAVVSGVLAWATSGWLASVFQLLTLVSIVGLGFFLNFFRDPERVPPPGDDLVISPADGEIIIAEADVDEPRFLRSRAAKISIFMSPLNVHVNRAPVDGEVVGVHYNAGKYFAAYADKASLDNEQNAIVMRSDEGRGIVFVQIAGFLARRIVCRVGSGMRCRRGERVGMIKLGSRVDVFVPGSFDLSVKLGDRVRAGETVLGVLR